MRPLPLGGQIHYRCFLPVLISAAYAAVHMEVTRVVDGVIFSAAYAAVH